MRSVGFLRIFGGRGVNRITYWSQGVASLLHKGQPPSPPLDNIRGMVIVWRLRGNFIRTAPCWVVWHNVHSQQHTHVSSSYRSSRLGLSHWDPEAVAWSCIIVTWWSGRGGIQALSERPTGFLQCFHSCWFGHMTCKNRPQNMTYNVFNGTINLAQSINLHNIQRIG